MVGAAGLVTYMLLGSSSDMLAALVLHAGLGCRNVAQPNPSAISDAATRKIGCPGLSCFFREFSKARGAHQTPA